MLAGEFYNERRKVVPYERIPKRLVQAFIAAEDADFFDHFGVDVLGTARAAFKTVAQEGHRQGQGAGRLDADPADGEGGAHLRRGLQGVHRQEPQAQDPRGAAWRGGWRRELTKEEILYLYLNNVYLGHHSYGVQSAAENYYRKDVKDLTLAEMALIAGLPQAPSTYSPFTNPEAAKKRRHYVLGQMLEKGMITKAEHDEARKAEVHVFPVEDVFHEFAPYFTEEVRRDVVDRYGNKALLNEGLKVFTTMDSEKQRAAQEAVLWGLLAVDKRQGFRGPARCTSRAKAEREKFIDKADEGAGRREAHARPLLRGAGHRASPRTTPTAEINVGGQTGARCRCSACAGRARSTRERYYPSVLINKVSDALKVGDVVLVRAVKDAKELTDDKEQWSELRPTRRCPKDGTLVRLEQEPELQSALVSHRPAAPVPGGDGGRLRLRRQRVQPRLPGLPAAGLELQAHRLLRARSS